LESSFVTGTIEGAEGAEDAEGPILHHGLGCRILAVAMRVEQWPRPPLAARAFRSWIGCVAFLAGLHLAAPSATAAASEASRERAAKKACLAGEVAKGVAILADLYVKTEDPVFIFNQARCFEQNGRYQDAIIRFREFLQKHQDAGHASDPGAEKHIAKCQALLDSQRQQEKPAPSTAPAPTAAPSSGPAEPAPSTPAPAAAAAPAAASPVPAAAGPAPSAAPGPAAATVVASPEPAQQARPEGAGLRTAGIAVAAVGLAGIVTGVVLNVKANGIASELETERPYQRSREDTRGSYETWGWVGYGVGGACLAGGAILYYLGYSRGRSSQVALVPSAQAGGFGATLQGAF
jgi:hypothetical protein